MSHTEGRLSHDGQMILDKKSDEFGFLENVHGLKFTIENARRLVACWNACDGIPTEWIEEGIDLAGLIKERDELLAVLRELANGKYTDELGNRAVAVLAKYPEKSYWICEEGKK